MLLNRLNFEQKVLFRNLCAIMAQIDDDYSEHEKKMIHKYCIEMQIEYSEDTNDNTADEVLTKLSQISSETEKRIITFELVGLIQADQKFHDKERDLVIKLSDIFALSHSEIENMRDVIGRLIVLYSEVQSLITR